MTKAIDIFLIVWFLLALLGNFVPGIEADKLSEIDWDGIFGLIAIIGSGIVFGGRIYKGSWFPK